VSSFRTESLDILNHYEITSDIQLQKAPKQHSQNKRMHHIHKSKQSTPNTHWYPLSFCCGLL